MPQPLLKRRLPARRGATEQPNQTSEGEAALTPAFWAAVAIAGVATGLFGALMMLLLFSVQHAAFGDHAGGLENAVKNASYTRRIVAILVAGAVGGALWFVLRSSTAGERSDIDDAVWGGDGRLSFRRSLGSAVISEIVIGMGASIGREAAPKLLGGASGSVVADRFGLSVAQRRLLVACGGGAGLAAVYNVPLGGALFTAEILCGSVTLPTVLPALVCTWIATITAWVYLPRHATYLDIPTYHGAARIFVWAAIVGPVFGLLAAGYIRLIGWVSFHRATGRALLVAPLLALGVLGLVGLAYPQLFGNGKGMAHDAFIGAGSAGLFGALFVLKPLVTALCLGSGTSGGLFTPVMSSGAVLGAFAGLAWSHLWPGSPTGAYAMIGATAMIGAAMQAPLSALALVLELTHSGFALMIPMMIATTLATIVARYLDGYSIYTARLPAAADE